MRGSSKFLALAGMIALALALAACGGDDGGGEQEVSGVEALPDSSCGDVEFGGEGEPSALIASDLPMQGDSAERSEQMVEAIRLALDQAGWVAGSASVAFQPCDDSIAETGEWDAARCRENAEAYAANPDVIGVVGTYNSGCAAEMIPILNEAEGGPVAMVSPANTLICLTEKSTTCERNEPDRYYPSGKRTYARVVPNDAAQGAGLASFAQRHEIENPYVLYAADDPTSLGQAETFQNAAEALDITIAGFETWDPKAKNYTGLMEEVEATGADGVLLAGLLDQNGARLIRDKVAVMGPNLEDSETGEGGVALLAPDGFAQQATIDDTEGAAAGMFVSVPGTTPDTLSGRGRDFAEALDERLNPEAGSDQPEVEVELFAPYAAQAADVLLQAAERSADRAGVLKELIGLDVADGIIGDFTIEETGDPSLTEITVSVAVGDRFQLNDQISPPIELIAAARGEEGVEVPDATDALSGTTP